MQLAELLLRNVNHKTDLRILSWSCWLAVEISPVNRSQIFVWPNWPSYKTNSIKPFLLDYLPKWLVNQILIETADKIFSTLRIIISIIYPDSLLLCDSRCHSEIIKRNSKTYKTLPRARIKHLFENINKTFVITIVNRNYLICSYQNGSRWAYGLLLASRQVWNVYQ